MRAAVRPGYRPPWLLRSPHVQSMLASSALRRVLRGRAARHLERASEWVTLDCGGGVRLTGCHTAQDVAAQPRGLAVLFHGWEGSVHSTYLLRTGVRLLAAGWDVFRLNFRDHGGTHGLNRGLFHSCRIAEVVGAVGAVARRWRARPLTLTGFSLGGNFALRVALAAPAAGIDLACTVAVCPVIDAHHGLYALEHGPRLYHDYFLWKWRRSLRTKQRLFPATQLFTRPELRASIRSLTETLVLRHTDFGSLDAYLNGYSLADGRLAQLRVPTAILAAADDPVCPASDLEGLVLPPNVEVTITPRGGHCGFIRNARLDSFAEDYVAAHLALALRPAASRAAALA